MITTVIIAIVCFAVGGGLSYMLFRYGLKSKYDIIIKEAQTEAEVIKKNKLLEVKEKFLNKKADLEKEVALRNQKIQQAENKLKQRELMLNQKQEEVQRKRTEAEAIKENLEAQIVIIDKKKDELDKLQMQEREKLEALSGLSAEEAKERLIESLKEEAKTQAASYINDIMDDAKLTANKEAKRIVIQSIQRVATETAIENSVTVFHIESDEIKGRIIGREGRNIRALEAATGVEIVVDDTPEAIVLSAFDPVRREIARLALHQLVTDGRIHPARIEEVVAKVRKQVEEEIIETGKRTTIDLGIHGLHPELIRIIGKMKYRSSYGQNLLQHARETANLCAVMASELGLNPKKEKSGGLVFYTGADEKNVKVKKGKLILTIRKDSASGKYLYTSGRIFTKQYFRYGKFEIKAKLPVTAGVWPALWFKANSGPACVGEIDLVEYIGCMKAEKMNVNVHLWGTFGGKKNNHKQYPRSVAVNISNYHIYTLEMLRGKLVFKVDGKVVYEVKKGDIEYWPFDETSYRLMIALSYGGTWAGSCGLADNSLPQSIKVDYVKYYRLKEECND